MKRRKDFGFGFLGLFLLLFFLNTVSHDIFCHEELHTVCGPLHTCFISSETAAAGTVSFLPPALSQLAWKQDHITRPDFIKNIFLPPD